MNIHGDLHGADDPSPQHLNVTVEHTGYEPTRLDHLLNRLVDETRGQ